MKQTINHPLFGEFNFDEALNDYCGTVDWCGSEVDVYLSDYAPEDSSEQIFANLHTIYAARDVWDRKLRQFAAEKYTALANDWRDDDDTHEITAQEFAERLQPSVLNVCKGGLFTFHFEDDDLFAGHSISVDAMAEGELLGASMQG